MGASLEQGQDALQSKQTLHGQRRAGAGDPRRAPPDGAPEPLQQPPGEGCEVPFLDQDLSILGGGREVTGPLPWLQEGDQEGLGSGQGKREVAWGLSGFCVLGWTGPCATLPCEGQGSFCCRPLPPAPTEALLPQHTPPGVLWGAVMALTCPL